MNDVDQTEVISTHPRGAGKSVPLLQRQPHPAMTAALIMLLLVVVVWWADCNGFLGFLHKWRLKQDQKQMYGLAARVGGDYGKLTAEERKWVEEVSHGHGRMAMGMYGSQAKQADKK